MNASLQPDVWRRSVGQKVRTSQGESIGKVVEIISDDNTHDLQYIILQSYIFYGARKRYFAIPASSVLLKMDKAENIVLKISTDTGFSQRNICRSLSEASLKNGATYFRTL